MNSFFLLIPKIYAFISISLKVLAQAAIKYWQISGKKISVWSKNQHFLPYRCGLYDLKINHADYFVLKKISNYIQAKTKSFMWLISRKCVWSSVKIQNQGAIQPQKNLGFFPASFQLEQSSHQVPVFSFTLSKDPKLSRKQISLVLRNNINISVFIYLFFFHILHPNNSFPSLLSS